MKLTAVFFTMICLIPFALTADRLAADSQGGLVRVTAKAQHEDMLLSIRPYDAFGEALPGLELRVAGGAEIAYLNVDAQDRTHLIVTLGQTAGSFLLVTIADGQISQPLRYDRLGRPLNATVNAWGELEVLLAREDEDGNPTLVRAILDDWGNLLDENRLPLIPGYGKGEVMSATVNNQKAFDPPPPPPPPEDPNGQPSTTSSIIDPTLSFDPPPPPPPPEDPNG